MDVVKLVFNFLFGSLVSLWNYFVSWWANAIDAGLDISPLVLVGIFLTVTFVLASGFAAMTFAEMKFRHRGLHFAGGVLLPVFYPVLFYYLASKVGDGGSNDDSDDIGEAPAETLVESEALLDEERQEAPQVPESEFEKIDQPDDPVSGGFPMPATPVAMNKEFFASISRLEDGTAAGPFTLELVDGTQLSILSIAEALPEVVSVEMEVDGEVRRIRLPYSKINDCVPE